MNMIADDSEHDRTWNEINYELVSTMARMSEYILNSVNHDSFKLSRCVSRTYYDKLIGV